ncbi:MAG: hypothetical protein RhofKO_03380 [Rhodothermales bacterium]
MRLLAIVCLALGPVWSTGWAQNATSVIEGNVLGWNGEPMGLAVVEVAFRNQRVMALSGAQVRVDVGADGAYRVEVDRLGYVSLQFSGALHRRSTETLFLMQPDTIRLDVQLAPLVLDSDQSYTRITTGHTDFDYEQGAPLQQVSLEQYTATVPAPLDEVVLDSPGMFTTASADLRIALQAMNVDGFRYEGNGEFHYLAAAPADSFTLRIDAVLIPRDSLPGPQFAYGPENRWHEQFAHFHDEATTWRPPNLRRYRPDGRRRGPSASPEEQTWEQHVAVQDQAFIALRTQEPVERTFEMLNTLIEIGGYGSLFGRVERQAPGLLSNEFKRALREQIPPTSLYWNIAPALLRIFVADSPTEQADYLDAFLRDHPTASTRREVLHRLAMEAYQWEGASPRALALGERLLSEYPDTDEAEEVGRLLSEEYGLGIGDGFVQIRTGISFQEGLDEWPNMDSSTVLIDFYNLGCATCFDDLRTLSTLYATFKDDGFEIVSFAVERDLEQLYRFAADNAWPWRRYALRDGFLDVVTKVYGVTEVPHRVLYHGGKIVAVGEPLRGAALEARIRFLLDPDASP